MTSTGERTRVLWPRAVTRSTTRETNTYGANWPSLRTGSLVTVPVTRADAPSAASPANGPACTASTRRAVIANAAPATTRVATTAGQARTALVRRRSRTRPATNRLAAASTARHVGQPTASAVTPHVARAIGASLRSSGARSPTGAELMHGRQT